ncbi:MAG: hypothetical protein ACFFBJ_04280 [Promethearchaeota archaeon]|jgi:hypothetical protein
MMTLDLREKFNHATSVLRDDSGSEDVTTLIHRTPWVRILLEYDRQESESFFIEVEVSLPESTQKTNSDTSHIIDVLSEHLQYLQKLRKFGFELCVIGSGNIFCASKEVRESPDDNLFTALIPPETG